MSLLACSDDEITEFDVSPLVRFDDDEITELDVLPLRPSSDDVTGFDVSVASN